MTDKIFGNTFKCECGKTHTIEPREIVYANDASSRLADICASAAAATASCAVIMDIRTEKVAGSEAIDALSYAFSEVRKIVVPDNNGKSPICDDITKDSLKTSVADVNIIVTTGSGVINDLGKWLAAEAEIPFVSFATAASMNGYASANVAPTIDGVKTLVRACPPVAVLASPATIENAPHEMTASGLGDILAKSVSSTDWKLNTILFGDYYCERSVGLIAEIEPLYLDHPQNIRAHNPEAMGALFNGLLLTGAAMTMAETSSPSSGGEHMISHTLDMMSSVDGVEHDLHGRQVGVGTVLASELYRRVLSIESPEFSEITRTTDSKFWGKLAGEVNAHYSQKIARIEKAHEILQSKNAWDNLRSELSPMLRAPEKIRDCLKQADAAFTAEHIKCRRERLLGAFSHAHEIRSRFTILDLARLVGVLPGSLGDLIDEWAM